MTSPRDLPKFCSRTYGDGYKKQPPYVVSSRMPSAHTSHPYNQLLLTCPLMTTMQRHQTTTTIRHSSSPPLASDLYSYHQPPPCLHSSTPQVNSSLGITSSLNGPRMDGVLAACLNGIVIRGARCVVRRDWCNPYARNLCL